MVLALQVLAVLGVAGILRKAAGTLRWSAAVVLVVVVLGVLAIWNDGPSQVRTLAKEATAPGAPAAAREGAGGTIYGAREDFLAWIDGRVSRRAAMFLVCRNPACSGGLTEWITYRLGPRPFVARMQDAQYVVVYDATLREAHLGGPTARAAHRFDARLFLAPVRR